MVDPAGEDVYSRQAHTCVLKALVVDLTRHIEPIGRPNVKKWWSLASRYCLSDGTASTGALEGHELSLVVGSEGHVSDSLFKDVVRACHERSLAEDELPSGDVTIGEEAKTPQVRCKEGERAVAVRAIELNCLLLASGKWRVKFSLRADAHLQPFWLH